MDEPALRPESVVVATGRPTAPGAPLNTPIVLTAPYRHDGDENAYSRGEGTETRAAFEQVVGALEGGTALAYASGMAAIAAVVESRRAGFVAVAPVGAYSGAVSIFADQERLGRATVRRVDIADTAAVVHAVEGADLVWLETVTNPLMAVADVPAIAAAAHEHGALLGVDATFTTPLGVRALDLGADVVMHSATKYLAGHSDLLMGVLVMRNPDLHADLLARRTLTGAVPGALESYLATRGVRTLALRWERSQHNAGVLAERLAAHPRVSRVRYPGLADDPGHAVATRDHAGYGAMVGVELGGDAAAAERLCTSLRLITHATSLGGVETLIERRAMHAVDAGFGTPPDLLRLSVGVEHVEDLWADLAQALDGLGQGLCSELTSASDAPAPAAPHPTAP